MISVPEAKEIVQQYSKALNPESLSIGDCSGLTLAEDVFAPGDFPAYGQSSMDGYAFRFDDLEQSSSLLIDGEIAAGAKEMPVLKPNTAIRIFTGAPLPSNADTVVMQEKVKVEKGRLIIEDAKLTRGVNTRGIGSDILKGALAAKKGTTLSPALLGFLAGIGFGRLKVFPKPRISIIVTGRELIQPGTSLAFGQVYESNSFALRAVLTQLNIDSVEVVWADDDPATLNKILGNALKKSDLILLAGGISVGDYDFVLQATQANGIRPLFHKVRQKPGKPLFFGIKDYLPVFGLPGNPSSVLTCFYEYVVLCIEKLIQKQTLLRSAHVRLSKDLKKNAGLTHFLKARFDGTQVTPLDGQESYKMNSYAQANCLVVVAEEKELIKAGEMVEIHHTDYFSFM